MRPKTSTSIELDEGYSFVRREALQRYAVLQMDVKGRDMDSFLKEASSAIAQKVQLPSGYWTEWGGALENQQRAMARLALIVPLTIGLIFMLLYTAFNSPRHASLIIANVPFAVIVGLFVSGQYLSVPSAIGFIAVFGVAMLNGIVLVSFLNDQRRQGLSIREAVRQGAVLRSRPVLMTASVAILGLIPMLLSTGLCAETQRPLATVVVGGLFTSTALTLLLLPLNYEWSEIRAERRALQVGQAMGFRLGYAAGPLNVAVAASSTDYAAGKVRQSNIGASWDFGVAKLMGHISRDKAGTVDGSGWLIGGLVPMGAGEVRLAISQYKADQAVGADPRTRKIALGYVHNLSKRTALYTTFARVRNDGGATHALNASVTAANASSSGYDFGLRHSF